MRYINGNDVQIVRNLTFCVRLKGDSGNIYKEFKKKYSNNPEDYETAFSIAFLGMLSLQYIPHDMVNTFLKEKEIYTSFEKTLTLVPDYWLARFFKCLFMLYYSSDYRESDKIQKELDILILEQEAISPCPYFLIPYIMLSNYYYCQYEKNKARLIFDKGKRNISKAPIKILVDYFSIPFKKYLPDLGKELDHEFMRELKETGAVLFPEDSLFQK